MSVDNSDAIATTLDAAFAAVPLTLPRAIPIQPIPFPGTVPCYLIAQTQYKTVLGNGFRRQSVPGGTVYTVVFLLARLDKSLDPSAAQTLYDAVKDAALTAFNTEASRTAGHVIPAIADLGWRVDPQGPYITWLRQSWVGAYMTITTTEPVQRTNP